MRRYGCVAALLVLLSAMAIAPAALAGPPGKWTRVTGIEGVAAVNTDELGLERTADGILHIAWARQAGGIADVLLHSAVSANAKSVSGPDPILAAANNGINPSVELVAGPSGSLRVLFAGLFPETPIDQVMSSATAPAAGAPWSAPEPVSNTGVATASKVYIASGIGGAVSPAGLTAFAWGDSGPSEGGYHLGLDPLALDTPFSNALERDPNVAFDQQSGAAYVAWNVLGGAGAGNSLMILPVGAGGPVTAPKSGSTGIGDRVSISGRIGAGGVYVAYGYGSNQFIGKPALWRIGAPKVKVAKNYRGAEHIGLAPAPGGRLWIYWERDGRLYASRSNASATNLGTLVSPKPPKGTKTVYRLQGEGSHGPLDLLALADAKGGLGFFHQRVLPGLKLTAKPKVTKAGKAVTFRVTDAGAAVKGAKVQLKLGKKKLTKKTNGKGMATVKLSTATNPGKYTATARRGGYTKATIKVRVKG
ncbi:MAG: hypothetical protein R2725_13345 [Solirubrobacterales bacterium]